MADKVVKKKPVWQNIVKGLVTLYVLYLAVGSALLYFFADKLSLFPDRNLKDKDKVLKYVQNNFHSKVHEVKFPAVNNDQLNGWYFENNKPKKKMIILVSHGNAGNIECRVGIAAYFLNTGVSVFLYDYRGYGESEGVAHLSNLVPDAQAAYKYVNESLGYKASEIVVYGESIGCGVTSSLANNKKCAAVILQSPFTSLTRAAKDHIFFLHTVPDFAFPPNISHLDNLGYVKRAHPPLLLIHGEKDYTLPCSYSKELFKAACEPKSLFTLPMAGHNDVYEHADSGLLATLTKFIDSLK